MHRIYKNYEEVLKQLNALDNCQQLDLVQIIQLQEIKSFLHHINDEIKKRETSIFNKITLYDNLTFSLWEVNSLIAKTQYLFNKYTF